MTWWQYLLVAWGVESILTGLAIGKCIRKMRGGQNDRNIRDERAGTPQSRS